MSSIPTTWACEAGALDEILHGASNGGSDSAARMAKRREQYAAQAKAARFNAAAKTGGRVAVLPIYGALTQRGNWFSDGTLRIEHELRSLVNDPAVKSIILDIDSPGGSVSGTPELANTVFEARQKKPIIAYCNYLCASAGYWIASQASRVFSTQSGVIGSIGVYSTHLDLSKMNERVGIGVTYISAGKYKIEGNPDEPLTAEAKGAFQREVDQIYGEFLAAVSRGRGVSRLTVRTDFGEGRTLMAKEALAAGMIDQITTFDKVLSYAGNSADRQMDKQAADDAARRTRWATRTDKATPEAMAAHHDLKARRAKWAAIKAKTGSDDPLTLLRTMALAHNGLFFGGKLKRVEITAADLKGIGALACCRVKASPIKIEFDHKFLADAMPEALIDVLLHEQIHQHLAETGAADPTGHGEAFAAVCNRIGKQRGWPPVDPKQINGACAARLWPPRELKLKSDSKYKVTV